MLQVDIQLDLRKPHGIAWYKVLLAYLRLKNEQPKERMIRVII